MRRPLSVTVAQAWAWILVCGIVAFLPTPFGLWREEVFYASLASMVVLGCMLTLTAFLSRRSVKVPANDTRSRIRRRVF